MWFSIPGGSTFNCHRLFPPVRPCLGDLTSSHAVLLMSDTLSAVLIISSGIVCPVVQEHNFFFIVWGAAESH